MHMKKTFTIKLPLENPYLPVLGSAPMRHTIVICHIWKERLAEDGLWKMELAFVEHLLFATTAAKSLQSCLTLCRDWSPPGSPIPGILQARTLGWVAISFSNAWRWKVKVKLLSRVRLLAIPWITAYQAPLSMGFSRQEYWSGVPLPSPSQS